MTSFTFYAGEVDGERLALTVKLRPITGRIWGEVTNAHGARVPGVVEVEGLELSIWCRGGGQCVDTLAAVLERGTRAPGLTAEDGARLLEVWRRWHGNGMQAGCSHQCAAGWAERPIDPAKPTNVYGTHFAGQRSPSWNMLAWVSAKEHPEGLMSRPCSTCGYPYGSAWLFEPLPAEVEAFIRGLSRLPAPAGAEGQARAAASAAGLRFTVLGHVDRNPSMPDSEGDHWRVKLSRKGLSMTLVFTKGSGHGGKPPTIGEVLECLRSDASSLDGARDFEDWARELGLPLDSRTAEQSYRAVVAQSAKFRALVGDAFAVTA